MPYNYILGAEDEQLSYHRSDNEIAKVQKKITKLEEALKLIIAENALLTINEAAEARNVSRAAINDMIKRNRLRTVEVFGKVMVFYYDVEYLTMQKPGPKRGSKRESKKEQGNE